MRYTLTCDLKNNPSLISAYKEHHKKIWPEITRSIREKGIEHMEIYLAGTRLFMIIEANPSFSFEKAAEMDGINPLVQKWEELMQQYQQSPPFAARGEKWVLMEKIFDLKANG